MLCGGGASLHAEQGGHQRPTASNAHVVLRPLAVQSQAQSATPSSVATQGEGALAFRLPA